ncbi:hypothetical protein KVT40_005732 [Elsinoe batatas]|uniref:C2H2-type domain-containing protein n=1 Tax=Elsinoe batatas TaxID=2601811 RepID=A0A8K0L0C4_9PEZI|nr:hypothetical protein KVT40_005732 [Elsinoe batatas]
MAVPHNLPRRRPASPSIDTLTDSMKTVSIAKGSTFQVPPKQDTEVLDPFLRGLSIPSLPCRSATCPKSLEDLLIGAGERRAVELLKRVDEAIAKNAELSNILSEPEVLPVPRFMVEHAQVPDSKPPTLSRQDSQQDKDSGIGSSIVSTEEKMKHMSANDNTTRSAVNRSIAGSDDTEKAHQLSEYAQKQIHRHIIEPILKEEKLKEFHPLIKDVPSKIGNKDIRSLRDLEKTLIFLAPDYSESPTAYRSFCETSIRCLHLAVNSVHETDRCSPTDRPYTTNYFIDLVEQIRRYASILAATRAKQAQGEELDEMDATSSDEIELQGGVSHNGKPAVLTRRRGSKIINMATNQVMSEEDVAAASAKRHMEDDLTDDDGVRRSMARRKKNEPIRTYYCKQDGCSKQFKRPCDLTKHVKTHERPWKCPDETCKYHEVGWPTEKERERHVNDKHSDSPVMYKCLEPGCPYTSKRESNCKQHMEKAHDIPYVRSKNNGKGKAVQHLSKVSPSVKTDSAIGTPFTPPAPSPSVHSSASGDSVMAGPSNYIPESNFDFADFMPSHFNTDYLNPASSIPFTPSWSNDRRTSVGTGTSVTNYSPFDPPSHDFSESWMKTEQYDFTMFDAYQQPTPDSINNMSLFPDNSMPQINANADLTAFSPHVSPGAQDMTFGTHFNDAMAIDNFATEDFSLYGNTAMAQNSVPQNMNTNDNFGGLDNMGGQFSATQSDSQHDILSLFPELKNQN